MRIAIQADEWYPVLTAHHPEDGFLNFLDVDEKTFKRWKRTQKAFEKTQDEISAAMQQQYEKKRKG